MIYERISEYTEIETYDDGNICIIQYNDKYVELNMKELANIPQVKNLIHAAQLLAYESVDIQSQDALQSVYDALAPFKCLPGDNEQ